MKNYLGFLLLFPLALLVSCAARPVLRSKSGDVRLLEEAIFTEKINSQLIKKYFEPREVIVSGSGYRNVEDIVIRGESLVDGKKVIVNYNISAVSGGEGNIFRIPFSAEGFTPGVLHNGTFLWSPGGEEAGLLLSFDDNYWHNWSQYFDLFDSYGAKLTFFLQGSLTPDDAGETELETFCARALERGHSLGYHSINHFDLRKVSLETFFAETLEPACAFFDKDIPLSAFAYPFGFSDPWMRRALSPVFPVSRGYGTNIRFCDTGVKYNGYIVSKAIDNIIYPDRVKFERDIFLILLAAKFTGQCIVPLTTHDISPEAQWGIDPERLKYLLKTAGELKLKFYTYSDFSALFPG